MFVRTVRCAVNQLQLIFCVFLCHALISKMIQNLSLSISEITLDRRPQSARERKRIAAETRDERVAALREGCPVTP